MTFGPKKGGKLRNVIMHIFILANQKTESLCIAGYGHMHQWHNNSQG